MISVGYCGDSNAVSVHSTVLQKVRPDRARNRGSGNQFHEKYSRLGQVCVRILSWFAEIYFITREERLKGSSNRALAAKPLLFCDLYYSFTAYYCLFTLCSRVSKISKQTSESLGD